MKGFHFVGHGAGIAQGFDNHGIEAVDRDDDVVGIGRDQFDHTQGIVGYIELPGH